MSRTKADRSIKNRYAETNKHRHRSIKEYVEQKAYRESFRARCINGVCEFYFNGKWVSVKKFNESVPIPIVHDFKADLTNPDGTKIIWYDNHTPGSL